MGLNPERGTVHVKAESDGYGISRKPMAKVFVCLRSGIGIGVYEYS